MLPLDKIHEEVQKISNTLKSLEVAPAEKRQRLEAPFREEEAVWEDG
jgi:hypothetical protein